MPVTIQNLLESAIKHNIVSDDNPLHIRIYTENEVLFVMNVRQPKGFVETLNKQGLASLKSLYGYLSRREVGITETQFRWRYRCCDRLKACGSTPENNARIAVGAGLTDNHFRCTGKAGSGNR